MGGSAGHACASVSRQRSRQRIADAPTSGRRLEVEDPSRPPPSRRPVECHLDVVVRPSHTHVSDYDIVGVSTKRSQRVELERDPAPGAFSRRAARENAIVHDAQVMKATLSLFNVRCLTGSRRETVSLGLRKADIVGEAGNKPRKFRRPMPKVPKGAEANDIHLAGLSNSGGGVHGNRLDHEAASGRSQDLGRFGRLFLKLMGRYSKESQSE